MSLTNSISLLNKSIPVRGTRGWSWYGKAIKSKVRMDALEGKFIPRLGRLPLKGHKRKEAFLDITVDGKDIGRMTFALADELLPKTCENFTKLCTYSREDGGYIGTKFHTLHKSQYLAGGDTTTGDGTGGYSAFDTRFFPDENFTLTHSERGVISMANCGKDRNASQFVVTLEPCHHYDGIMVAFGHLVKGFEVLSEIESLYSIRHKTVAQVAIRACGVIEDEEAAKKDETTKKDETLKKDEDMQTELSQK